MILNTFDKSDKQVAHTASDWAVFMSKTLFTQEDTHHMQNILRLQGKELLISNNILIEILVVVQLYDCDG
jgi:hypothetical protein